jgi:hypothetical protein
MSRIRVTIDRLVLKGFEAGDRNALVEGCGCVRWRWTLRRRERASSAAEWPGRSDED